MTTTPKISVIVPVYKAENYLHRCVDSLLAQTFEDFEILLVDDGSPDASGAICDEYAQKDHRIRVFHKENGGVSSARQCGIDHAQGEYTIHADPDDWVDVSMLEELYAKAKVEDADMVICDFYEEYKDKQIYRKQQPTALDSDTVLKELFQQLHGSCWNKLVKRACYKEYGIEFDQELSFCEDLYFHASLLRNPIRISYLPKAFYHYDQTSNPNSIVSGYSKETYAYDRMLYSKFYHLLKDTDTLHQAKVSLNYMFVYRAFTGNVFTSQEFKERFKSNSQVVFEKFKMKDIGLLHCIFFVFSCKGFYQFMYKLWNLKKKLI